MQSSEDAASSRPPPADLSRLRIERGADDAAQPGGFPWIRLLIALGVLAVLFLFRAPLLGLFDGDGGRAVRTARAVRVVPGQATQGDVAANGYIVADTQASLATVLSGRLVELNAAEGDIVEKDAVVARIQYDDLEAQQRQAAAAHRAAQARLGEARSRAAGASARIGAAQSDLDAAILTINQLDEEILAAEQAAAQARENAARAVREVDRNRPLFEKKRIDAGTWDRLQTEARTALQAQEGAEARVRALRAGRAAWDEQITRRKKALAVARADHDTAQQGVVVAEAAASQAAEAETLAGIILEKTRIRAPFRGLVIRKDAEKGEVIAPTGAGNSRGSVLTIVDPESLEVQVELSERRIARVKEGDRAIAFLDALPEQGLPGAVRKIWPRADRAKGVIELRVRLDERPAHLRPDMAARVIFKGSDAPVEAGDPYVVVPPAALVKRGGITVVYVVTGGIARRTEIELGEALESGWTVTKGLSGGKSVVLDPPADLADGASVREEP